MTLLKRPARGRLAIVATGLVVLGAFAASFAIPYWLVRGDDTVLRAQEPGAGPAVELPRLLGIDPDDTEVTPVPGSTPDTSAPFWFIPYVNADNKKPRFRGSLGGLEIDPDFVDTRTGADVCPGEGHLREPFPDEYLALIADPGPFSIDPRSMPAGLTPSEVPTVLVCGPSEIWLTSWFFSVTRSVGSCNRPLVISR